MRMNKRVKSSLGVVGVIAIIIVSFQNCVGTEFSTPQKTAQSSSTPNPNPLTNPNPNTNPAASCPVSAINNCRVTATNSGGVGGQCALGYAGTCVASCNNGSWAMQSNSCTAIDPLTLVVGPLVFHAGGNTGTLSLQRSGNQISGSDSFPNWQLYPGGPYGIVCTIVGTVAATGPASGTIQFSRTASNGLAQNFVGTWTTSDFVHVQMTGQWTWQVPESYMPNGGPWDASN